jgi:hypothetical protein
MSSCISVDQDRVSTPRHINITFASEDFYYKLTNVLIFRLGNHSFTGQTKSKIIDIQRQVNENGELSLVLTICRSGIIRILRKVIRDQNMAGEGFDTMLRLLKEKIVLA